MSWRNQGFTGSNNIPLGTRRRFDRDGDASSFDGDSSRGRGRSRSPARQPAPSFNDSTRPRRRMHRWGDATDNKAAGLMGVPVLPSGAMSQDQADSYCLHVRIEEISQKLRIDDVIPKDAERSPSPPPQYDNFGKRVNTREARYRKKLEDERHKLVEEAVKIVPEYHPPTDYRRPTKTQEKVYVPVNDYPEINFIGLLIGPRGNTLKKMEQDSGAKIAIRGKGSVKEGKGRSDAAHSSNQEEDLHCLIMADTEEKVNKARDLVNKVIETAASIPEGQNELKRNQLRELASLNGTLRDDENQACQNCGAIGHRKYDCPERSNATLSITCRICGNAGHMARDCPDRAPGGWRNDRGGRLPPNRDRTALEYDNIMNSLGAGNGAMPALIDNGPAGSAQPNNGGGQDSVPPWQRREAGGPAPWARNRDDRAGSGSGAPPWASGRGGESHGYNQQSGGYGQPQSGSSAPPWQQGSHQQQSAYGSYGGYGDPAGGYGQPGYGQSGYGANQASVPWAQDYGAPPSGDAPPPPPPPQEDVPPPPPPM